MFQCQPSLFSGSLPVDRVLSTQYCYNAAISACGKSGQWREAKELLSTMRDRGVPPDLISYNSAIDACGKGGRWDENDVFCFFL